MPIVWTTLLAELDAGRNVFFVLVVSSTRGSPGTAHSSLLMTESGKQSGTIGGGSMEQQLLRIGQDALDSRQFITQIRKFDHRRTGRGDASGLICGGTQTNLLALLTPARQAVVEKVVESIESDHSGLLTISEKTWKFRSEYQSSRSIWLEQSSDWEVNLSMLNRKRVAIFGGGHCGAALARQMCRLGFLVTVIEPRRNLSTLDGLTSGDIIHTDTYAVGASKIRYPEMSFAVVLTPSARQDVDALTGILKYPFPYIGIMGSRPKLKMIKNSLLEIGLQETHWKRVTAPAGISIDSDTPEEISVSISAQILIESRRLGMR